MDGVYVGESEWLPEGDLSAAELEVALSQLQQYDASVLYLLALARYRPDRFAPDREAGCLLEALASRSILTNGLISCLRSYNLPAETKRKITLRSTSARPCGESNIVNCPVTFDAGSCLLPGYRIAAIRRVEVVSRIPGDALVQGLPQSYERRLHALLKLDPPSAMLPRWFLFDAGGRVVNPSLVSDVEYSFDLGLFAAYLLWRYNVKGMSIGATGMVDLSTGRVLDVGFVRQKILAILRESPATQAIFVPASTELGELTDVADTGPMPRIVRVSNVADLIEYVLYHFRATERQSSDEALHPIAVSRIRCLADGDGEHLTTAVVCAQQLLSATLSALGWPETEGSDPTLGLAWAHSCGLVDEISSSQWRAVDPTTLVASYSTDDERIWARRRVEILVELSQHLIGNAVERQKQNLGRVIQAVERRCRHIAYPIYSELLAVMVDFGNDLQEIDVDEIVATRDRLRTVLDNYDARVATLSSELKRDRNHNAIPADTYHACRALRCLAQTVGYILQAEFPESKLHAITHMGLIGFAVHNSVKENAVPGLVSHVFMQALNLRADIDRRLRRRGFD